jgi:hypothetical protein
MKNIWNSIRRWISETLFQRQDSVNTTAKYYRVVDDVSGPNVSQSTLHRWRRGEYNGNHLFAPEEWYVLHGAEIREVDEFPLKCSLGTWTSAARQAFIRLASEGRLADDNLSPVERAEIGEVEGTFAWSTPQQAWNYGFPDPDQGVSPESLTHIHVVEVEGEDLGVSIPEKLGGGRLVKVLDAGVVRTPEEFAKLHDLEMPKDLDQEVELSFGQEDADDRVL